MSFFLLILGAVVLVVLFVVCGVVVAVLAVAWAYAQRQRRARRLRVRLSGWQPYGAGIRRARASAPETSPEPMRLAGAPDMVTVANRLVWSMLGECARCTLG